MNFFTKREAIVRLFEAGAVHGDITSMRNLGDLYVRGEGMEQPDFAKAREWYEKAVAKGDPDPMFRLGLLYENGQGVVQDNARAREWFEKAAAEGDQDYIFRIGLFLDGRTMRRRSSGMRKTPPLRWATCPTSLATGTWSVRASRRTTPRRASGSKKPPTTATARALPSSACFTNNGQGVSKDYARAREWFEKAPASGESGTST